MVCTVPAKRKFYYSRRQNEKKHASTVPGCKLKIQMEWQSTLISILQPCILFAKPRKSLSVAQMLHPKISLFAILCSDIRYLLIFIQPKIDVQNLTLQQNQELQQGGLPRPHRHPNNTIVSLPGIFLISGW